ncbi:MAG: hypothetical protein ACLSHP_13960, partial [Coprococcus sp.]
RVLKIIKDMLSPVKPSVYRTFLFVCIRHVIVRIFMNIRKFALFGAVKFHVEFYSSVFHYNV